MADFFRKLLSAPATPQMRMVAFLTSLLVLLLFGNAMRVTGDAWLWPWILAEWGMNYAPFVYVAVWAGLFLITFVFLNMSLTSSVGMLMIYGLDKVTLFF